MRHQVEPDPAEMARRYGLETPIPDWQERLACSRCENHATRYRSHGRATVNSLLIVEGHQ
jgi:hypothetical protein